MIKAGYPTNLFTRLFGTYDPIMIRLDYQTPSIQRYKNRMSIETITSEKKDELSHALSKSYTKLNEREHQILLYRYRDLYTLKQCAEIYGVSVERIRQLEERACNKIQIVDSKIYFNIFWPQ